MNLPINDPGRNLAVALLDPESGKWYDWAADQLSPFDPTPAKHLRPAPPIKVQVATAPAVSATNPAPAWTLPPNLFSGLKNAGMGVALLNYPNLVPVWFQLDAGGNVLAIADLWPNPIPFTLPIPAGGWGR